MSIEPCPKCKATKGWDGYGVKMTDILRDILNVEGVDISVSVG